MSKTENPMPAESGAQLSELDILRQELARLRAQVDSAAPAMTSADNAPAGQKFRVKFGAVGGYEWSNGVRKDRDYRLGEIVDERHLGGPESVQRYARLGALEHIAQ